MRPFFLEVGGGHRFFVHFPPSGPPRDAPAVVYVPPFAEEMNKCRHMAAVAARRMAARGIAVVIPDLHGCGDSAGAFGQASWGDWCDDIQRAADWLAGSGQSRVVLWGVRVGALLAAAAGSRMRDRVARYLFWQPVINGELAISQFLRLKVAGEMLSSAAASAGIAAARESLAAGTAVEVAGYDLTPAMAQAISTLRLVDPAPHCPVQWFEVASDPSRGLAQASSRVVDLWRAQGVRVDTTVVPGQPFWTSGSNEDVVDCVELLAATDEATQSW